jgi:hypothetical protein
LLPTVPGISKHVFATLLRSQIGRRLGASLAATAILAALPALPPAPSHVHSNLVATANPWLDRLNLWRTNTGVAPLSENTTYSSGDYSHSVYMVKNNLVTHYETPGVPYYTVAGDTAARNSNIEVNSTTAFTDEQAIDWWMAAPFHSMGMMDPRLAQTGFGAYREAKSGWAAGFSLDTIRGNSFSGGSYPVYFPGNGATEPLTNYSGNEFPDPLQACPNYSMPTGLPLYVEIGGNVNTTVGPVHTLTGNGVALANCVIDSSNTSVGSYLYSRGSVVMVPERPLQAGVAYVVALTVNGTPYTWSFTVGPFVTTPPPPGWQSLGGALTSTAGVSSWSSSRVDVFARGTDNALYQNTWSGAAWSGWGSRGGVLTSSPSAVSWSSNRIDVFVRGTDNQMWHKFSNGTSWSNYESLGGVLTSGPAAASWAAGRLDVFVVGTDRALYHKWWNGAWSNWESLGGTLMSDPAAVSWGANRIDVFARGTDDAMWQKSWDGQKWSSWQSRGGALTSGPAASSCASGHLDVFVVGSDYAMYRLGYAGSWSSWSRMGGAWAGQPGAACSPSSTTVQLIERGPDTAMWQTTLTGS